MRLTAETTTTTIFKKTLIVFTDSITALNILTKEIGFLVLSVNFL